MTRKIKSNRKLWIPIFSILLIVYSILVGLPTHWLIWGFIAVVLDFAINPIYERITYEDWD